MSAPHDSGVDDGNANVEAADDNITPYAADDDWQWRRKIRSNLHSHRIYRIVIGIVGLIVVVIGLIMVPFPGPGWLVVFLGLALWASEFEWAQRLLRIAKHALAKFTEWLKPQQLWIRTLVGLVTVAAIGVIFWLLFLVSGVPALFPDIIEDWLKTLPGLAD